MYVVVAAVYRAVEPLARQLPVWLATLPGALPLVATVAGTAAGANLVNNLPLSLAAIRLLESVPPGLATAAGTDLRATLAFGTLVGMNLGPNLSVFGSLATMLVLASARRQGITVSGADFLRVGLLVAPPMLLGATAMLWPLLH
jgi:arsenical pump membrane protein